MSFILNELVELLPEGVYYKIPEIRKISAKVYSSIKLKSKDEIYSLCNQLLEKNHYYLKIIAFDWAFRQKKRFDEHDFQMFEKWVMEYILDWDDCDDFCTHALGEYLIQFPCFLPRVFQWKNSDKWSVRRVSAVALIYPVRKGYYLKQAFQISQALMDDEHYLVQKGFGWLLKEASKPFLPEVNEFVMRYRKNMTRLALRYSIEKFPVELRKKAMEN